MLKCNIYPGLAKEPDLTKLVTDGKNFLHGVEADASRFEGIAVEESLVQAAVRRVEALQHLGLQSVRDSWREGGLTITILVEFYKRKTKN